MRNEQSMWGAGPRLEDELTQEAAEVARVTRRARNYENSLATCRGHLVEAQERQDTIEEELRKASDTNDYKHAEIYSSKKVERLQAEEIKDYVSKNSTLIAEVQQCREELNVERSRHSSAESSGVTLKKGKESWLQQPPAARPMAAPCVDAAPAPPPSKARLVLQRESF